MSYSKTFKGKVREEVKAEAEAFMKTLDPYEQPSISGNWEDKDGTIWITVQWYGLD